jgi:ABC-type bacteriocin/lantibiotic exporter with double-glycine peptidase domain
MLEQIIDQITSNPLLMIVAALLAVLLVVSLLKKLFKLALYAFAAVIVIFAYVYFTSDTPEKDIHDLIQQGSETLEKVKDKAGEAGEKVKEQVDKLKEDADD